MHNNFKIILYIKVAKATKTTENLKAFGEPKGR